MTSATETSATLDNTNPARSTESTGTVKEGRRPWIVAAVTLIVLGGSAVCVFLPLVPEAIGAMACVMMLALLFLRVPVAVAMLISSLLGLYALRGMPLIESTFSKLVYNGVAEWTLSVVPMFVLMGLLLWRSGMTDSIYLAGRHWLNWLPGGLAVGTNVAGTGLAAVSGSSVGTAYALARMGIPEMLKAGYDRRMAIGAVIVAGLPGQLIPPSIMLVIYAGIAEVPIGPQLLAGIGPGLLVAVMFTLMIVGFAVVRPELVGKTKGAAVAQDQTTWKERLVSLVRIWPVPLLIVLIIAGMFSGVFTATEVGAAAALFSLIVALMWKRKNRPFAALTSLLTLTGISTGMADAVESLGLGRVQFLLVMVVVYLILGMFMDPMAIMVLTIPILIPTLNSLDISLMWFGVFTVFMGELAVVTPPVGILAFIIHGMVKDPDVNMGHKISLKDVFVSVGWFLPMAIAVAVILILVPEIATFIPDMAAAQK